MHTKKGKGFVTKIFYFTLIKWIIRILLSIHYKDCHEEGRWIFDFLGFMTLSKKGGSSPILMS